MLRLLSALLLLSACNTAATSHSFIGCNWFIPQDFSKISDNEYRKLPADNDLSGSFSAIIFSKSEPDDLAIYMEMDRQPDTKVLAFSHADEGGLSYKSLFIERKTRFGDTLSSDILLVAKNDQVVSMLDVSQADSLHTTSACITPSVVEQHHLVKKELGQGIKRFLETDHGLNIVVPELDKN